ncbi:MAG: hypothetical protein ACR2MR_06465 [Dietzia maris]
MKKTISLTWYAHHEPGIHYAHHEGRLLLLRGFPLPTEHATEFEVHDGRGRVGLIQGLQSAKDYAARHLEDLTR